MPIHAISGMPGNGKTAFMMEMLINDAKKAERPIFHAGIKGVAEGLGTRLDDPREWNAIDPDGEPTCNCKQDGVLHAHKVPDGAKIYIDEAWQWFGHLHDATRQATPKHVLDLAQHRHRGIDFVWTFQSPNQLYPFVRGLIQDHWHCLRKYGLPVVDIYKWPEFQESVKSKTVRAEAMRDTRPLPKHVFGQYTSASEHTIKTRLPWRVYLLPVGVIAIGLMIFYLFRYLSGDNATERMEQATGQSVASAAATDGQGRPTRTEQSARPMTIQDHLRAQTPVMATQPWTAPMYGELKPETTPMIYCMAGGIDTDNPTCRCITEQGTKYHLAFNLCLVAARDGIYNPNKPLERAETASAPVKFDSRSDMFYE